jgi:hypothetical protein
MYSISRTRCLIVYCQFQNTLLAPYATSVGLSGIISWFFVLWSMLLVSHYVTLKQEQRVLQGESDVGGYGVIGENSYAMNDSWAERTPLTKAGTGVMYV